MTDKNVHEINKIGAMETIDQRPNPVQTIEQTSKRWKKLMLIGMLLAMGSCVGIAAAPEPGSGSVIGPVFVLLWIFGVAMFVYAKVMRWWNHG